MAEQDTAAAGRAADQLVGSLPGGTLDTAPPVGAPPSAPVAPTSTGRATMGDLFHARFGGSIQDAVSTPEGQAAANSPGGFMKMILASAADALAPAKPAPGPSNAQRFVEGFDKFIAPLSNLKGSAFEGAGNVAKADLEQREKDRREAEARNRQMTQDQREKLQFGLNVAQANMNMIHSQYLLHKDIETERDKNIDDGKKAILDLKNQPNPGVVVQEGIDAATFKKLVDLHTADIKNGVPADQARGIDPTQMTAYATGKEQVGTNENGVPQYENRYTVIRLPEKYSFTDKEQFKSLGKYLFKDTDAKTINEMAERISEDRPLVVDGSDYNYAFQARETANAAKATAQAAVDDAAIAAGTRAATIEAMHFDGNGIWAQDLGAVNRDPKNSDLSRPEKLVKALEMIHDNPPRNKDGSLTFPNLDRDIAASLGEKNMETVYKEAETARNDREKNRIADIRANAAAKKDAIDKAVSHDYDVQLKRLDADRKINEPKLAEFSNVDQLLQHPNAENDKLLAIMMLKAIAAGGGVRITNAEISAVTNARSWPGGVEAFLNRVATGKSLSREQRTELNALAQVLRKKVQAKSALLIQAEPALASADTVEDQQRIMAELHQHMAALEGVETPEQTPGQNNAKAGQNSAVNPPTLTAAQRALPKAPQSGAVMPKDIAQRYINAYQDKDAARKAAEANGWKLGQ